MKKQLPFIAIKNQVIFPNASDLINYSSHFLKKMLKKF